MSKVLARITNNKITNAARVAIGSTLGCLRSGQIITLPKRVRQTCRCYRLLKQLPEVYHPVNVAGLRHLQPKRCCEDRIVAIRRDMQSPPSVVVDIGCQIGFFTFVLAGEGYAVSGYDINAANIAVCNAIRDIRCNSKAPDFYNIGLKLDAVEQIPNADYALCLAVFHHIIHYHGLEYSTALLSQLRSRISRTLYFEMGQSNEPPQFWSPSLPDMGRDPLDWIQQYLCSAGFRAVRSLGLFPNHLSDIPRYLIAADI